MSRCTGFASTGPHVAAGSPMRRASCSVITVRSPARPGTTIFGPPLKPAKKCGSTKPVVMRTSASTHTRFSSSGTPSPWVPRSTSAAVVARVVVDHLDALQHRAAEHRLELRRRVAAVRARRDRDRDRRVRRHRRDLVQQHRQHQRPRLGARAVADRDDDAVAVAHQLAQRRAAERRAHRRGDRRRGVVQAPARPAGGPRAGPAPAGAPPDVPGRTPTRRSMLRSADGRPDCRSRGAATGNLAPCDADRRPP